MLNHPFIELLGGHPQAISLTAPLLKDSKLKDLFLTFCDSNLMDVVHENSVVQNPTSSLRVSLELSISRIRDKNPQALDLFGLIGLLPSGVNKEEITQLWGDKAWKNLKDALVRSSLLIHKSSRDEADVYYMLPFMSERACEILDENKDMKHKFHMKCCKLYKNYCFEFYMSEKSIEDIEGLASIESNIWACIYRALEGANSSLVRQNTDQTTRRGDSFQSTTTLGGPDSEETPRAFSLTDEDSHLEDLLLDLETYRSLSPTKLEEEKRNEGMRGVLLSKFDWEHEDKNSEKLNEELMIIYYVTSLIFLNKNEDALKAVSEYLKKPDISEVGLANLNRIHAFLLMISIEDEHALASVKFFKKALRHFQGLGILKGVAICQLGVCKICHDRFPELTQQLGINQKHDFLEQCLRVVKNAIELFEEIGSEEGERQCQMILKSFETRMKKMNEGGKNDNYEVVDYSSMMQENNSILLEVIMDHN